MPLAVSTAFATNPGVRDRNEDFVGLVTPSGLDLSTKGLIAAVADGVSGNEGGREASEYSVRGLLADYYATPETWAVTQSLERVITAINSWIQKQGSIRRELAGMASTLTALVLRGNYYYFSHVGDTRLYLLRDKVFTKLTSDHVWDRPEMQHVLTRAVGLDTQITIDHGMGRIMLGDVFLLLSDGVWSSMSEYDISFYLSDFSENKQNSEQTVNELIKNALENGSKDNLTALVLKVDALPEEDLRDALSSSKLLPLPPLLRVGQVLDGLEVDEILHQSMATVVYRVHDLKANRKLVLKTLNPDRQKDVEELAAFAHEEWVASRAIARFFPEVVQAQEKNYSYYLTTWHDGATFERRIGVGEHFLVSDMISYAEKLVRAIGALHRRSILHRDIKPANIHLGSDGQLRILDFGIAQTGMEGGEVSISSRAGTPSYLAPEQFDGESASPKTDLYAVGVSLYYVLTRHYPYGEVEPFQKPRFSDPVSPTRYRPEIPAWFENILLKAVSRDPQNRFETAEEMLIAIERGASHPIVKPSATPIIERDALTIWRLIAISSLAINFLAIYLFIVSR
ncbi:serine/threonine protein phosphatase PrpC [Polynucleobacter sphagniphilus]|uniref:bifunctional protein-serine/threonine kinase/phosphatase n=1 Tax=Polynucleobacter sphagniphilus TaxID=1743169 RepID=UPI00247572B4|nr:bifunctional protein-serine/threonine kinase/phosphatase [Polynucleobacter sphagniphilus]MDH6303228.1 serine/threonine protein phosphatase PrpC [Polynucleobacter sphagniphilus]